MRKIQSKRSFYVGILTLLLALVCLGVLLFTAFSPRFLIAALLLLALCAVNFSRAFAKTGMWETMEAQTDERDRYIVMQSGHRALQILHYLLCAGCFICLVLYGALRQPLLLTVAITLSCVLAALFIILLCANIYFEKRA
nr:hypothetical protein [Maliibacterium massiliense]